ncbi:MAG: hypothetical protein AAB480_01525 [Patescibacteria group bacterium]
MSRQSLDAMYKKYGWDDSNPPPLYVGDCGWSMERGRREDEIYEILNADMFAEPPREASKETLVALSALIEETEDATRNNPETRGGMTWVEQSKFYQGLVTSWFRVTKNRVVR